MHLVLLQVHWGKHHLLWMHGLLMVLRVEKLLGLLDLRNHLLLRMHWLLLQLGVGNKGNARLLRWYRILCIT
jgi:hypothetical protein